MKLLPETASRSAANDEAQPVPATEACSTAVQPINFELTATLSREQVRAMAIGSQVPGERLAAAWRLLIHGQALPQEPPGEGLRCLMLLNLATRQDIEALEVLQSLDPSANVRAQAAVFLWRVTRDRDRILPQLISAFASDAASDTLIQLLALEPPLPFSRIRDHVRARLEHPDEAVRFSAWRCWLSNQGPIDPSLATLIRRERSPVLSGFCLEQWATSSAYREMLPLLDAEEDLGRVVDVLVQAKRSFRLTELVPYLCHYSTAEVLRLAQMPFDAADRRLLLSLAGLLEADEPFPAASWARYSATIWAALVQSYAQAGVFEEEPTSQRDVPSERRSLTSEERAWFTGPFAELDLSSSPPPDQEIEANLDDYGDYAPLDERAELLKDLMRVVETLSKRA